MGCSVVTCENCDLLSLTLSRCHECQMSVLLFLFLFGGSHKCTAANGVGLELPSESYIGLFDGDFHSVALQSTPRDAFSAYLFLL